MVIQRTRSVYLSVFLLFAAVLPVTAQEIQVSIRLHNEQVYFTNSDIELFITLRNESADAATFRIAEDRLFSLDFDVRDESSRLVPSAAEFIIARTSNQVFYRTILLEPGEQLSFVEPLTRYVDFESPGNYTVQARFFPGLAPLRSDTIIRSNTLNLTIRPGQTVAIREEMRFEAITEPELERAQLSPDEVVTFMLNALQQANWERFFLYVNLERLYRQSPARDRRFVRLSEQEQLEELSEYRGELIDQVADADAELVQIPDGFQIIETRYTPTEGEVVAVLNFDYERYRERRRFVYEFDRRNGFWELIGYTVSNLTNEALNQ